MKELPQQVSVLLFPLYQIDMTQNIAPIRQKIIYHDPI